MSKNYYQSVLLEHYKHPVGLGDITEGLVLGKGINPLCGDEICVGVKTEGDVITDIKYKARACSICIASSSIMTQLLLKEKVSQVEQYYDEVVELLENRRAVDEVTESLQPLTSVVSMPSRHKCALLSWEALIEALRH